MKCKVSKQRRKGLRERSAGRVSQRGRVAGGENYHPTGLLSPKCNTRELASFPFATFSLLIYSLLFTCYAFICFSDRMTRFLWLQ